jgi:hypothetical protein
MINLAMASTLGDLEHPLLKGWRIRSEGREVTWRTSKDGRMVRWQLEGWVLLAVIWKQET